MFSARQRRKLKDKSLFMLHLQTYVYASKSPLLMASINCSVILIISCLRAEKGRNRRNTDDAHKRWSEIFWKLNKQKYLSSHCPLTDLKSLIFGVCQAGRDIWSRPEQYIQHCTASSLNGSRCRSDVLQLLWIDGSSFVFFLVTFG